MPVETTTAQIYKEDLKQIDILKTEIKYLDDDEKPSNSIKDILHEIVELGLPLYRKKLKLDK